MSGARKPLDARARADVKGSPMTPIQTKVLATLLLVSILSPFRCDRGRSWAGEVVCDPMDREKCSTGLKTGDSAPFSGQLLTPKLAIELGQKAASFDDRLELELKFRTSKLQVALDLEKQLREIDKKSYGVQLKLLEKRLEEASTVPWYEHPAFVATMTAVGVALVVVGTGYALGQID